MSSIYDAQYWKERWDEARKRAEAAETIVEGLLPLLAQWKPSGAGVPKELADAIAKYDHARKPGGNHDLV